MHTSERGIRLIEDFEGFRAAQYDDGTGVMTIGYGTTSADFSPLPRTCTRAQAEQWLRQKLRDRYEPAVNALGVPLNQNQFDALVSLTYNCGPGAMQWQIGASLRRRDYATAANDFRRYVYAGGRVLQGLVNRREAERRLFLTPDTHTPTPAPVPIPIPEGADEMAIAVGMNKTGRMEVFVQKEDGEVIHTAQVSPDSDWWRDNKGHVKWLSLGNPGK